MVATQSISIQPIPKHHRVGVLHVEAGRRLHKHEMITLTKLLRFGDDIICQAESHHPGSKTADIIWRNEKWEIKNINGGARQTIEDSLRRARKQSKYIILDISDSKISLERNIGKVKNTLKRYQMIQEVIVFDKKEYCIINKNIL